MFEQLTDRFDNIFRNLRGLGKITDKNIQQTAREVRRVLLEADVHFNVARDFIRKVKERAEGTKVIKSIKPGEQFIRIIHSELVSLMGEKATGLIFSNSPPTVILMAGLQGSGKTTTSVKLAKWLLDQGRSVQLGAADVYRPAAIEQLKTLAATLDVPVYSEGSGDPIRICRNTVEEARSNNRDVVILDTAGRLHVDGEMMVEIQQIADAINPDEILFVVDGMTGQDAVNSALAFNEALALTGMILTKMDGDARGGAAVSIVEVTGKPIKFISESEKVDGLTVFEPTRMVDRIMGFGDVVSLVEKAQANLDEKESEKLHKKLVQQTFDLEDFKVQLHQLQSMGPLQQVLGMMPGVNRKLIKGLNLDDRQLLWTEAIINSMTPMERQTPAIINGSRRKRIARGSGRSVQEVNQLLKQFNQMRTLVKRMGKGKIPNFPGMG